MFHSAMFDITVCMCSTSLIPPFPSLTSLLPFESQYILLVHASAASSTEKHYNDSRTQIRLELFVLVRRLWKQRPHD
jgi:hypothetical protein